MIRQQTRWRAAEKLLLAVLLLSAGALMGAPGARAAVFGGALNDHVKAGSIVHQVPCRMRRYCDGRGCRAVRRCW